MIAFLRSILTIIGDAISSIINLIIDIPYYYNQFKSMVGVINIFGLASVTNMLIVIISIGLVIKIKRLLT